jgi:hypothetical protein
MMSSTCQGCHRQSSLNRWISKEEVSGRQRKSIVVFVFKFLIKKFLKVDYFQKEESS